MMVRTSRPTARTAVTPQTTYIAMRQTGVSTSGSPFSYCQPLAVVYKMLWAAVRIALTEVADLSVMWLVILVVASMESLPLRIS